MQAKEQVERFVEGGSWFEDCASCPSKEGSRDESRPDGMTKPTILEVIKSYSHSRTIGASIAKVKQGKRQ